MIKNKQFVLTFFIKRVNKKKRKRIYNELNLR